MNEQWVLLFHLKRHTFLGVEQRIIKSAYRPIHLVVWHGSVEVGQHLSVHLQESIASSFCLPMLMFDKTPQDSQETVMADGGYAACNRSAYSSSAADGSSNSKRTCQHRAKRNVRPGILVQVVLAKTTARMSLWYGFKWRETSLGACRIHYKL